MNLQPKRESIAGQKEFLNTTQGLVHKVGGITLDATAFTGAEVSAEGYVKAGSAVQLADAEGSLAMPFDPLVTTGTVYVTANDVKITDGNPIVGALETAFLKSSVVTAVEDGRIAVTPEFITASNGRFHLR